MNDTGLAFEDAPGYLHQTAPAVDAILVTDEVLSGVGEKDKRIWIDWRPNWPLISVQR
ncbi:hypothetical protein G5B47_22715 [Paenibacillus sp. 7124]|uniref:Uncharacterized protein n=1 Tax=Paenibacillus apii TaxID=1850370 RepID=A0A6M1PYD1_9BACL|nr:hypothetical protein [Paenibacillus apii]NGM85221.1 hypothetical protein [Paenibacillus apii]NJJ42091.1 hypothetical protein [Paenibacillus apii]